MWVSFIGEPSASPNWTCFVQIVFKFIWYPIESRAFWLIWVKITKGKCHLVMAFMYSIYTTQFISNCTKNEFFGILGKSVDILSFECKIQVINEQESDQIDEALIFGYISSQIKHICWLKILISDVHWPNTDSKFTWFYWYRKYKCFESHAKLYLHITSGFEYRQWLTIDESTNDKCWFHCDCFTHHLVVASNE